MSLNSVGRYFSTQGVEIDVDVVGFVDAIANVVVDDIILFIIFIYLWLVHYVVCYKYYFLYVILLFKIYIIYIQINYKNINYINTMRDCYISSFVPPILIYSIISVHFNCK